jgi:5-methylcytosine-specific restriction protein A
MSRKTFIESLGATCNNWTWSWSFVNHKEKKVIFGAWDRHTQGDRALIFSERWLTNRRGKKSSGYEQSRNHIRLIEENGYTLMVFPMKWTEDASDAEAPPRIGGFTPEVRPRTLARIGDSWYATNSDVVTPLAEELPLSSKYLEGTKCQVTINAYERNPKARAACISHHGLTCAACKFNFADTYGTHGEGFIHVHHIVPLGLIGAEYEIDPIRDLVPVCPNCHAMIHRAEPPLSIQQVRQYLRTQAGSSATDS